MGDGMRVLLCALKIQHFAVTALGRIEILTQRTGVTKVAEGIGEFPKIVRRPVPSTAASQAALACTKSPRWRKILARCLWASDMMGLDS